MIPGNHTYALNKDPNTLVKAVVQKDSDTVSFWSIDGGFQYTVPKETFENDFRLATDLEIHHHYTPNPDMQYVAIEDGPGYQAYIPAARWNGWAMPSFPAKQALKVMQDMNPVDPDDLQFQIKRDDILLSVSEAEYLKPTDIIVITDPCADECDNTTELTSVNTYGEATWSIGAGSWVWSVVELDEELLAEFCENEYGDDFVLTDEQRSLAIKLLAEEDKEYWEIADAITSPISESSKDLLDGVDPVPGNSPEM